MTPDALVGLVGDNLVTLGVVATMFVAVFLASQAALAELVERRERGRRLHRAIGGRLPSGAGGAGEQQAVLYASSSFDELVKKASFLNALRVERTRLKLLQAGYGSAQARIIYVASKIILPVAALPLTLLYVMVDGQLATDPIGLAVVIGVPALAWFLPDLALYNKRKKRYEAIRKGLPDVIDLLVVCAEAGLSLDVSLKRVSAEVMNAYPELGYEIDLTATELKLLPERREALVNLTKRVDIDAIASLVTTLVQTEKYGTPLSQSLRVLATDFRERRILKAEEKAARLPAMLTVPMIVFILPTLFIVIIGPAILDIYDNFITR
jgi:tight adherence protein C